MEDGMVPLFLFLLLISLCGIFGYCFAKWFLQRRLTELDTARRAADIANSTGGANETMSMRVEVA